MPNNPRRRGDRDITYAIDGTELYANPGPAAALVSEAIDSAMGTWDDVICSTIPIVKVDDYGFDLGYIQWMPC